MRHVKFGKIKKFLATTVLPPVSWLLEKFAVPVLVTATGVWLALFYQERSAEESSWDRFHEDVENADRECFYLADLISEQQAQVDALVSGVRDGEIQFLNDFRLPPPPYAISWLVEQDEHWDKLYGFTKEALFGINARLHVENNKLAELYQKLSIAMTSDFQKMLNVAGETSPELKAMAELSLDRIAVEKTSFKNQWDAYGRDFLEACGHIKLEICYDVEAINEREVQSLRAKFPQLGLSEFHGFQQADCDNISAWL